MKILFPCISTAFLTMAGVACQLENKEGIPPEREVYNTTIVVNFKKNTDREFTAPLMQFHPLHLTPDLVPPPPNTIDTSNKLRTVIKLALPEPKYLALGFNTFYIEPGDSLDMDFETLIATKMGYKDSVTINHGNVFFVWTRDRSPAVFNYVDDLGNRLIAVKDTGQLAKFLSANHIDSMIDKYTKLVYQDFPNLMKDDATWEKLRKSSGNYFYWHLMFKLKHYYSRTKDKALKDAIEGNVTKMMERACTKADMTPDPLTWGKYLSSYIFFKEMPLDGHSILSKFDGCNDTIQQYIQLNLIEDGLLSDTIISQLSGKITYPLFKEEMLKISQKTNRGISRSGYINTAVRNITLYDTEDRKVILGDIFTTAKQPYILFDFCGSWCKPCIEEIGLYSESRHLDQSQKVKPIWLFFENDKTKWLGIIEKYKLKREHCYIIEGASSGDLKKEFALLFDWAGEFPHYFLFAKDGKVIKKKAPRLSQFEEKDLPLQ